MEYSFSCGMYDSDGDKYDEGIFIFVGKNIMLRFDDIDELEDFANSILDSLPEISQNE